MKKPIRLRPITATRIAVAVAPVEPLTLCSAAPMGPVDSMPLVAARAVRPMVPRTEASISARSCGVKGTRPLSAR